MGNFKYIKALSSGILLTFSFCIKVYGSTTIDCPSSSPNGSICFSCGTSCLATLSGNDMVISGNGTMNKAPWRENTEYNNTIHSVTIGKNIEQITVDAFMDNKNLTSVNFEKNAKITNFANAFTRSGIQSIVIPASVTSLSAWSFQHAPLTNIEFEEGSKLTYIGYGAFHYVMGLDHIFLPPSVVSLDSNAFASSFGLDVYCPTHLAKSGYCSSNYLKGNYGLLQHYDFENGNYIIHDKDDKIMGIYKSYNDIINDIPVSEHCVINSQGLITSKYDGRGNIIGTYRYDKGGNLLEVIENGNITYRRRIYTPAEATAAVQNNKNTFSIIYR